LEDSLERLPFGAFVFDMRWRVVQINRADAIIADTDGLAIHNGFLVSSNSGDTDGLHLLIRDALALTVPRAGAVSISRAVGRRSR
jgi:hypothetical protein